MSALIDQLKKTARLPSPPGAALLILKLAKEDDVSLAQVADTLATDQALSVRILKYANSALVGVSREITTVREAVVLLGLRAARMMALSFSLVSTNDRRACPGFDYGQFWSHSLAHAVAARNLAQDVHGISSPEEAFAAGLLASLGKLVFVAAMPREYGEILIRAGGTLADASALEKERFGADYREAGGELLTEWGIPQRLAAAVRYQCDPGSAAVPPELQDLVRVVNEARQYPAIICNAKTDEELEQLAAGLVGGTAQNAAPPHDRTGDVERKRKLLVNIRREFQEIASVLSLDRTAELDVTAIQAEAGEVLTELSLSAQLHREAAERENRGLQAKAWTDGLTGIHNRAAFDGHLEELWREAVRNHQAISIAMIDIDRLKKWNDTYGHRIGDAALRAVAQCLQACVRQGDFLARYGGDEFVIIMPNADRIVVAGICVSVRRAVEQKIVEFEGEQHHMTISLGAAILPCATNLYAPQLLIEAADQQLYHSKEKGRNRCSMQELPRMPNRATLAASH